MIVPRNISTDKAFLRGLLNPDARFDDQEFHRGDIFIHDDGKDFLSRVGQEGLSGWIYFQAQQRGLKKLFPLAVWESLEKEYLTTLGRNMLMDSCVQDIAQTLEDHGVMALIVRGAAFFKDIYPSLGTRPFMDIDIVLKEEDFSLAEEMLRKKGYENLAGYPYFLFRQEIHIDVHLNSLMFWRFRSWPSYVNIQNSVLWERCPSFRGFRSVRTLDVYDALLSCCEHLQGHSFNRLIWFLDIALLLKTSGPSWDWNELNRRAEVGRIQKPLGLALTFLSHHHLAAVPSAEFKWEKEGRLNGLERRSLRLLLKDQREHISGELLAFFSIPGWGTRIKVLRDMAFLPQERFPLARPRIGIWGYVKRLIRIFFYLTGKALRPVKA